MTLSVLLLTIIMFGGGGFLMGQALGETWRPWWQILPYGALLAIGNQYLGFALFGGPFFVDSFFPKANAPLGVAILAYLFEAAVIIAFGLLAFRLTRVRKLVSQYPWLYERRGPFAWKDKIPQAQGGK
jgi:hypothetical protein